MDEEDKLELKVRIPTKQHSIEHDKKLLQAMLGGIFSFPPNNEWSIVEVKDKPKRKHRKPVLIFDDDGNMIGMKP